MRLRSKKQQNSIPLRRRERDELRALRPTDADLDARYSFRRNRTITGSLVSGVASASEDKAQLRSTRVQAHDLRRHRKRLLWVLGGSLICSGALFFLVWDSIITPHAAMSATGGSMAFDERAYDGAIETYLTKHPSQRFRFSLNRTELAEYLQANGFPEVDSVDQTVQNVGYGAKRITLHMRRAAVVWTTGKTTLYVDTSGVAFERNYYTPPAVSVVDQSGIQAKDNQVLVSNRFLGFIGKLTGAVAANGYSVTQIILPVNTTRQVEMMLDGVGYPIKLSVDRPVGEQAEDAAHAVQYMVRHGLTPRYVDVRVSGRAYYQ